MTWTKIDSSTPEDPRLLRLPRSIRWMHLEGLVWCNQHGTDGHIPAYALGRVTDEDDPVAAANKLVAVGLWEASAEGWSIVAFLDDQPSAADVERTQALARERQRKQRQHRNGDHTLCNPQYCKASRVTNDVSHDTRTVPSVPTRAEGTEGRGGEDGSASSGGSASLATPSATPPPSQQIHWMPGTVPPGVVPFVNGVPVTSMEER